MDNINGHQPDSIDTTSRNGAIYAALAGLHQANPHEFVNMPFVANEKERLLSRLQQMYLRLQGETEEMAYASDEGVLEVVIRSRTKSLTFPLSKAAGNQVAEAVLHDLHEQLHDLVKRLFWYVSS